MAYKIFIDGLAGTTGLQIKERLQNRDAVEIVEIDEAYRKEVDARLEMIDKADLTLLCLPDTAAKEIAAKAPQSARLIDASTTHRTNAGWVYAFPELAGRREKIKTANRLAVPGCHASGFLALTVPLLQAGIIKSDETFFCQSISGYSGGGKAMIAAYEDTARPDAYDAPRRYALGMQHKHLPEMVSVAGLAYPPLFLPTVAAYYSGLLVSVPLPMTALAKEWQSKEKIAAHLAEYYGDEKLFTVHKADALPPDGTLSAGAQSGKDTMEIFIGGSATQLLLSARYDNLGKGASGAAVQAMNLRLGLPEYDGLVLN